MQFHNPLKIWGTKQSNFSLDISLVVLTLSILFSIVGSLLASIIHFGWIGAMPFVVLPLGRVLYACIKGK